MNDTILLLIILLLINIVQFVAIYRLTQNNNNANADASEIYQKQIRNYNNIIRLTEKLTKEVMNKAKEEKDNEKNVEQPKTEEQKPGLVYPESERRVYWYDVY